MFQIFIKSPYEKYPDLWPFAICLYSFLHFILFVFLFHLIQFTLDDKNNEDLSLNFNSFLFKTHESNKLKIQ
jgi:hypothetical protein